MGYNISNDLAVIKVQTDKKLKAVELGSSNDLKVGQFVAAIGNPGGLEFMGSVTYGIISGLNRTISDGDSAYLIQTDAAINPGNSGGALVNTKGQLVGINSSKIVSESYEGMGFAIPSVTIKEVADEIIKNGYVTGRAKLGVSVTEFSDYTAKLYDAPAGIKVDSIDKESSVTGKDVKVGDIITKIDGTPTTTFNDLFNVLDSHKPGDTVTLTIYRIDEKDKAKGKEFTVKVELLGD